MKANRYAVADGPPALHIASDARHYAGFRPICLIQLTCPLPPAPYNPSGGDDFLVIVTDCELSGCDCGNWIFERDDAFLLWAGG